MIVATRLSAVWQVAGVAAAALCCYLVSQSVASERAQLIKVDRQIAATHDQIAGLQMEIGVRARMGQLESWNRDVLALQAPRPSQFVASGVQLASLYGRKTAPALRLDPAIVPQQGGPTMAAYHAPAAPLAVPAAPAHAGTAASSSTAPDMPATQPLLRTAAYVRPAADLFDGQSAAAIHKAAYKVLDAAEHPADMPAVSAKAAVGKAAPVKLAARDPLPKSLLPADIGLLAAREVRGTKGSGKAGR